MCNVLHWFGSATIIHVHEVQASERASEIDEIGNDGSSWHQVSINNCKMISIFFLCSFHSFFVFFDVPRNFANRINVSMVSILGKLLFVFSCSLILHSVSMVHYDLLLNISSSCVNMCKSASCFFFPTLSLSLVFFHWSWLALYPCGK